MGTPTFFFEVSAVYAFTAEELWPAEDWPDGDGPENPTVDTVRALIDECGGDRCVIRDWDLAPEHIVITRAKED